MKDVTAADLLTALARTVLDSHEWNNALRELCDYCGASKALISRRSVKDAQIIIPTQVRDQWQSPLIYGFSKQDVESFATQFGAVDPWNQIEAQNFPYTPYAMQRFLPIKQLRETAFWQWLEPQGIVDCIVAKIDQDESGWTALNLHLDADQARDVDGVLQRLASVLADVSAMWTAGRDVFIARSGFRPVPSIVDYMSDPCIVLNVQNVVSDVNPAASELSAAGTVVAKPKSKLQLPKTWQRYLPSKLHDVANLDGGVGMENWQPFVARDVRLEHLSGEEDGYRIVFIVRKQAAALEVPDWNHADLNEREKLLVRHLAQGGQVKDGAALFGISVRANADIWKSARLKLGGLKKQDLVLRNRDFIKDEER
ncbi:MAG: hypothetical protein ACRBB0_16260 [Pelagimonas sp.]|uniref:hypothetical protein n=1 Tax=Pelagimonas sp. TaxID=2073170 RepID=UPI003D6ACF46